VAAAKNENGIARIVLSGLALLLLVGVVGSFVMGVRARNGAIENAVTQARTITDNSLTLVFRPEDTSIPASDLRAENLTDQIRTVVVDPSDFDTITLWSSEAQILYATEEGRIGNRLEGERDRIREALRGKPQTVVQDGQLSVMLPLQFDSGVGQPVAVELTRSDVQVVAASAPWRTNMLFSGVALLVVVALLIWTLRTQAPAEPHPVMVRAEQRAAQAPIAHAPKPIAMASPGMREEAEARRHLEERAAAAEDRLALLQDQYRKTLEELQESERRARNAAGRPDPRLEERALQAENRARQLEEQARDAQERARTFEERSHELEERARLFERQGEALQAEHEELARRLAEQAVAGGAGDPDDRTRQVEQELIGLRAELEGSQTQLAIARRELETLKPQAERARELQGELDSIQFEALRARETSGSAQAELSSKSQEMDDLRAEVRALRAEEQRAAMLEDELRAAKAELGSLQASHRAELIEREAELEEKVRTAREEFQTDLTRMEAQHREEMAAREFALSQRISGAEDAAQQRLDSAERELQERTRRFADAEDEIAKARAEAEHTSGELAVARAELETTVAQLLAESERARELNDRVVHVEQVARDATARAERASIDLEAATQDNADLNRRLQEIEARRQLEIAGAEGRADLDDILRVTQERLAGQTEKLIAAEERAHELERQVRTQAERLEEIEAELRQQQMAQAMREIRGEGHEQQEAAGETAHAEPIEDRRATTPFMQELSLDAKKSLTRILGITQVLKHKKDAKEQAQLVRQLTAHTRRLDHIVSDLSDAERLVRGTVELTVRRTDLEPLIRRVIEESGVDADHEVRVIADRLVVAVDQLRTEQIVAGLVRASGDRTPPKKTITIRLEVAEGGAIISVEDPESSSDASLSPVVKRFAEVQGGWASVEGREEGGSSFKVFLPDGAGLGERPGPGRDVKVVVDAPGETFLHDSSELVDELHRISSADD
jgi:chromosome segregation ATPase